MFTSFQFPMNVFYGMYFSTRQMYDSNVSFQFYNHTNYDESNSKFLKRLDLELNRFVFKEISDHLEFFWMITTGIILLYQEKITGEDINV